MKLRASLLKRLTDAELVKLYLEGCQLAFTVLEAKHQDWLMAFAFVLLRNQADCKDVIQNMWEKAQRHFNKGGYHEEDHFKNWLGTLLYHEAIDWLKKRPLHGMSRVKEKMVVDVTPVETGLKDISRPALRMALKTLSVRAQTIIDLHFFKKKTFKEIAVILGRTVGAVTNAYSRALKKLRKLMSK